MSCTTANGGNKEKCLNRVFCGHGEHALRRKLVCVIAILLVFLLVPLAAFAAKVKSLSAAADQSFSRYTPAGLEKLIREALANNPALKTAENQFEAYSQKPAQERSWDNPRLGFGLLNLPVNSFSFDQEAMTQKQVTLAQKIPFPGKLPLKGEIADKDVKIAGEAVAEKRNDLISQVKTVYWDLLLINKTIAVTNENIDLLRDFVKTAESRYAVGKGIQQDVLKAQVELSRMIDLRILQERKRGTLAARMNALLYRPMDTRVAETGGQDLDALKPVPFLLKVPELEKMAAKNSPELAAARRRVEKSGLAVELAKKDYYPDFDVAASYGQRDGRPDFVSGSVFVTVPLWHKTKEDRKVAQERYSEMQARQQYNSMEDGIFFDLKNDVLEIKQYDDQIGLLRTGLIPQARAALQSAIAGYSVDKVDFVTLINNQITLYNYEIEYYQALTNYENTLAGLEAAVGKRLF